MKNIEAEKNVLAAIIFDPEALLTAADIIEPGDFYSDAHRCIFNACLDVYQDGSPIDIVSITERLKVRGEAAKVDINYLSDIAFSGFTSANIKYHSQIVKNASMIRHITQWTQGVQNKIKSGVDDIPGFLGELEQGVIDIASAIKDRKSPHAEDIYKELKNKWDKETEGFKVYIPVDSKLEMMIPRYNPGHLWIIAGYTSVGKSTFLAEQIVEAAEAGAKVLIFSLEDSREEKLIKLIANISSVSQRRLMTNQIKGKEENIRNAMKYISDWGVEIYEDVWSVDEIRLKIKKHKIQHGVDIVCLDYIQNIQGNGSLYERISDAIIRLQQIAKELQVTIIVVSQVSNEAMRANSEIIGLKGAGELAATADIVLWLKRNKEEGKERWLTCEVRKNRPFGITGFVDLFFSENYTSISKRGM